jgi:hypothetical protein
MSGTGIRKPRFGGVSFFGDIAFSQEQLQPRAFCFACNKNRKFAAEAAPTTKHNYTQPVR